MLNSTKVNYFCDVTHVRAPESALDAGSQASDSIDLATQPFYSMGIWIPNILFPLCKYTSHKFTKPTFISLYQRNPSHAMYQQIYINLQPRSRDHIEH